MPMFPNEDDRAKFEKLWVQPIEIFSNENLVEIKWKDQIEYLPFSLDVPFEDKVNDKSNTESNDHHDLAIIQGFRWNGSGHVPFSISSNPRSMEVMKKNGIGLTWDLPDDAMQGFTIKIPPLKIDGVIMEFPEITFAPKNQVSNHAINC